MTGTPESIQKVEDLVDLMRRDPNLGMTVAEMRRYVRELDDHIDSCDLPGAFRPFHGAEVLSQAAVAAVVQDHSKIPDHLYRQVLDEADETSGYLLSAAKRANACKCRRS